MVFSSSHAFANPDFFFHKFLRTTNCLFFLKKPVIAAIVFYFDLNEDLLHGRKTKINKFQEKNLVDSEKHFCFLIFCKHYISMTSYPFNFMRYFLNYISNRKFGRTLEDLWNITAWAVYLLRLKWNKSYTTSRTFFYNDELSWRNSRLNFIGNLMNKTSWARLDESWY